MHGTSGGTDNILFFAPLSLVGKELTWINYYYILCRKKKKRFVHIEFNFRSITNSSCSTHPLFLSHWLGVLHNIETLACKYYTVCMKLMDDRQQVQLLYFDWLID